MVAITKLFPQPDRQPNTEERRGAIARLKELHSEAQETAHLANLLGRSRHAGLALPVLAVLSVGLSDATNPATQLVWCGFVAIVSIAILTAYRNAMKQPFERVVLKEFAKDLSAILLFAGFAWGAGAFLALPSGTSAVAAILFATAPAVVIAYLLRDREALYLFLAPVAALTLAACLMKPFAGGILTAALVALVTAAVAGSALYLGRVMGDSGKPAMLSLP